MNKLSKRQEVVASFIQDNSKIIDIGCDHGLLSIYLANKYKNIKIIASDVNKNALSSAIKNIKTANTIIFSFIVFYTYDNLFIINRYLKEFDYVTN